MYQVKVLCFILSPARTGLQLVPNVSQAGKIK